MGYTINKKQYNEFIDYALKTGFDNEESAKWQLKNLINLFNKLPDTIKLYRLVFLSKKSDLRKEELGSHYVLNKRTLIQNHYDKMLYNYSEFENSKPYMMTVETSKSKIDFYETIRNNLAYPNEQEITLKDKGKGIKLISLDSLVR
jgi:hypothetical protein